MTTFGFLLEGIQAILRPEPLLLLSIGVFIGMVVGVLPGIGPSAGIAILLPLTFGVDPTSAVVMLAAIYYGAMYGGTLTSVLINTPGESATVATTFDGYPLAKRGRAGAVLVLCAVGSLVAGTIGALGVTALAPVISRAARTFGPAEFFLVVLLGLLMIIVIIGGNPLYGAISALVGFALATVGSDLGTGLLRYTFGSPELIAGIDFLPIAIGVFGLGEVLYSLFEGRHLQEYDQFELAVGTSEYWPTRGEWRESIGPMGRGSVLGFLVGALPGAGATLSSLISYSVEKTVSRRPEDFGKGAMPGVVGPEAANNAASAGAMIPLLTLGIPGSGATAVLLGGFILWGLRPGPLLMTENPEFAWGLIASMYLGNVMLAIMSIFAVPFFASFMKVPYRISAAVIAVLCVLGTYTVNGSPVETWIMFAAGVVGLFMKRYGFSPAALVLAVVLGPLAEQTLRQSLLISGGSWSIFIERPVARLLTIAIVLLVGLFIASRVLLRRRRGADAEVRVLSDE